MTYYLGLDVGGTNLVAGVIDENYHIISKVTQPTLADRSIGEITDDMISIVKKAIQKANLKEKDFEYLGIGMPSYVNPHTNLLVHANCFGWKNVPIYDCLKNKISLPIKIENDANCATLGETLAGAAKDERNVIMITLGTGVGGGIVINNKIYCGGDGMGAEMGHVKLVYKGESCTCGQLGCTEAYCSATALIKQTKIAMIDEQDTILWKLCENNINEVNGKMVFDGVKENDKLSIAVLNQYVDYLSCALSNYITLFRPDKIIIGGGLSEAGDLLLNPLKDKLKINTFAGTEIGVPSVVKAKLGSEAGLIGAAFIQKYIQ